MSTFFFFLIKALYYCLILPHNSRIALCFVPQFRLEFPSFLLSSECLFLLSGWGHSCLGVFCLFPSLCLALLLICSSGPALVTVEGNADFFSPLDAVIWEFHMWGIKPVVVCVLPQTEQGEAVELVRQASRLLMAVWGALVCSLPEFSAFVSSVCS